jgi:ribosome-binding protein aMBF1 (putative translation factor)
MPWTVETLSPTVDAEIDALPADMRARLTRYAGLIERFGPQSLPPAAFKHLEDRLWELRLTGRDGISRAIYVTSTGQRVVIVRVFVKKDAKDTVKRTRTRPPAGKGGEMTKISELHKKWLADPDYRKEYEALEEEFSLAANLIEARTRAGLTQAELASRMQTTQSVVARLESGRVRPSTSTLQKYAAATGSRLKIVLEEVA